MFKVDESASGESKKPNHVRRLNFGQSILTSDRVERCQELEDRVPWFNSDTENVACSTRDEFVRKWIETYDNGVADRNEKVSSSPILGLSATRQVRTSPVFGNQCRPRKRNDLSTLAIRDAHKSRRVYALERTLLEEVPRFPMDDDRGPNSRKGNVKRNLFDSPSVDLPPMWATASVSPLLTRKSPLSRERREAVSSGLYSQRRSSASFNTERTETNTKSLFIRTKVPPISPRSPILGMKRHSRKRKKRKLEAKENLRILDETHNRFINSTPNSTIASCPTRDARVSSEKANTLSEEIQPSFKYCKLNSVPLEGSDDDTEESTRSCSPGTNVQSMIDNSPQRWAKSPTKPEIRFSSEDDEPHFTDRIEDSDTQDLVVLPTFDNHVSTNHLIGIRSKPVVMFRSQRNDLDSDRTFFSKAEQVRHTPDSVQSSPKISHISSQVTDTRSNGSSRSQTGIIVSTETSPRRATPDFMVQLTVMDSGKKRKKPKRGSLMEKLQLAINRRISFVRAWKHRLKQTLKGNTIVPCVTIFVQRRTSRFGREFLDGTVLEDRFSLLPLKEANVSTRHLTIMIVPEVTGKTETKSEDLIQIFPPWETLDVEKLTLNVTYIRTIPNCDETTSQKIHSKMARLKRSASKEYHCPCISANTVLPSCKNGANKPNVMEKLMRSSSSLQYGLQG